MNKRLKLLQYARLIDLPFQLPDLVPFQYSIVDNYLSLIHENELILFDYCFSEFQMNQKIEFVYSQFVIF